MGTQPFMNWGTVTEHGSGLIAGWMDSPLRTLLQACLCGTVGPRTKKSRTVAEALSKNRWIRDIAGALTVQVTLEYLLVWDLAHNVRLQLHRPDVLHWKWTADKSFSTSSPYRAFFIGQHALPGAKILHKARTLSKCKFFIWLVLHDRCWTAARRKRHNLQDDDSCVLCNQLPETAVHLLLACPTAREVWFRVLHRVGWHAVASWPQVICFADWWSKARKNIPKEDRKCFDTLVISLLWLWKERNKHIYNNNPGGLGTCAVRPRHRKIRAARMPPPTRATPSARCIAFCRCSGAALTVTRYLAGATG